MIAHFYSASEDLRPLRGGRLGPHMDGFATRLSEQGYSRSSGRQKIELVADLSRWLERRHLRVAQLNERRIATFLAARWRRRRRARGDQSTLALLLRHPVSYTHLTLPTIYSV